METRKPGISLENKLLTSSKLPQGPSLISLQSKYAHVSGADWSGRPSKTALRNSLLESNVGKDLTTNKHLTQTCPRPLLSSDLKGSAKSQSNVRSHAERVSLKTRDLGGVNLDLGSKHLLSTSANAKPIFPTNVNLSGRAITSWENKLLKTNILSTTAKEKEPQTLTKSTSDETDGNFLYLNQLPPVYELEFYEENFSKELSGKSSDTNDFNENSRGQTDLEVEKQMEAIKKAKLRFLTAASAAMIRQPNFYLRFDEHRKELIHYVKELKFIDPEFVFKVALYLRRELNIRTCANFIIAVAASHAKCRPYLRKYFNDCIVLPSDWINVAEFYVTLGYKKKNFESLPTALRKAMVNKFPSFDGYQLAKYNKEKSQLKRNKELKKDSSSDKKHTFGGNSSDSDSDSDSSSHNQASVEEVQKKSFTLKQLIRKLHISDPSYSVMCLVGKKYPATPEEFRSSRLEGMWEEEKAGKRMKLPIPETWETQVSLKGNKPSTWEQLLDHKKLPFMAMLRNLRNMLQSGISDKHHNIVIKKLSDEQSVIRSKQFPFRFLSAYEVLNELDEEYKKMEAKAIKGLLTPKPASEGRSSDGRRGKGRSSRISKLSDLKYDSDLIKRYRKALDTALRISCRHNITPMPGSSIIICDVISLLDHRPDSRFSSKNPFGKSKTVLEISLLLCLMAKYSCESCKLLFLLKGKVVPFEIENEGTILTNLVTALQRVKKLQEENNGMDGIEFFMKLITDRTKIDNLMYFAIFGHGSSGDFESFINNSFVSMYRHFVNPEMLCVKLELTGHKTSCCQNISDSLDICISTVSDQILRFVAERGNSTLLSHVENIDLAFNLRDIKITGMRKNPQKTNSISVSPKLELKSPWWRSIRVFISSTFRDMHGERDLLTRYVFPELRSRAMQHFVNIYEIDLRWGITEDQSKSESQVEICLSEVLRSDIFIGIIGGRYGWIPSHFSVDILPDCGRLQGHFDGRSITELEMNLFALTRADDVTGKAFFYIRDQSFLSNVPNEYLADFSCENEESFRKLEDLKARVRKSGLEQYTYPCRWEGVVNGKPIVSGLESFGNRVMNNIWTSVQNNYLQKDTSDVTDGTSHEAFAERASEKFVGRKTALKQCNEIISSSDKSKCSILMVSGKTGSGKTSFMAKLYKDIVNEGGKCIGYFADAKPNARSVQDVLQYLFISLLPHVYKQRRVPDGFRELQNGLSELLEDAGEIAGKEKILILMDGTDLIETTGGFSPLRWLPDPVPKGIIFVISCNQNGLCAKTLESRSCVMTVRIGPLDMMERTEFVRRLLRKHRKELDESAFNNQMKLLVSKREANLPIFLKFACEELRFFGVYEKVSDHLRELAQTVPMLLQNIANRLEEDHGKALVSSSLLILYLIRKGISEDELYDIVCLVEYCGKFTTRQLNSNILLHDDSATAQSVSRVEFAMFTRSLKGFIQQSDEQTLQLSSFDVRNLVKHRYVRSAGIENTIRVHRVLAAYYKRRSFDVNWKQSDAKALSEVVHHMAAGGLWCDLQDTLCSLSFIYVNFQVGIGSQLLEGFLADVDDLSIQQGRQRSAFLENPIVKEYQSFVSRNMHILNQYPVLTIQQALNDPSSQQVIYGAAQCSSKRGVVQWMNKPIASLSIKRTINFNEAVLSIDVSPDSATIACGLADGVVRIFDVATGNDSGNLLGHSDSVTSCCFIGLQKLVSSSLDCTLSVWNVAGGHRLHHLKAHRRPVTCCIPVPSSQQFVSVSYDCLAILWNIQTGYEVARFTSGIRPYNTAACDQTGRFVALGGWDCVIKVWDILANKRQNVLKGHESSIRAVAFSPSGSHIVSSALLGDVYVWAAKAGTVVGKFSIGAFSLSSIRYTTNGLQMIGACADSSVKVWSGSLGQPCGTSYDAEKSTYDWALSVAVDSQGKFAYVGYNSGKVVSFSYQGGEIHQKFQPHKAAVKSICISKDDEFIVTASDDMTAKIIYLEDSKLITLEGHVAAVRCVRISKAQIATGSVDCAIMLWDALFIHDEKSLKPSTVLRQHQGHVTCLDFSPCDTKLMSVSTDKSLIIWDIIAKKPLHVIHDCHRDWVNTCAWSDVGDFVVTGSNDFTLKLWDAKTGNEKYQFLGNTSAVNGVTYKFGCVASIAYDGSLRVWTHKGAEITTIQAHKDRVNGVFLWKPKAVEFGTWDVQCLDNISTNQLIKTTQLKLNEVHIVTVSDDGTLKRWKPFIPHFIENLNGHTKEVSDIAVSSDGQSAFSCSRDKSIRFWDPSKFESRDLPHSTDVNCVKISENGKIAASCDRDGYVALWDTSSSKLSATFQASTKGVNVLCFINDEQIVTGDDLGVLAVWHVSGRRIGSVKFEARETFPIVAMVRKGRFLACASFKNCCIYILDSDKPNGFADDSFPVQQDFGASWFMDLDLKEDGKSLAASFLKYSTIQFIEICIGEKSEIVEVTPSRLYYRFLSSSNCDIDPAVIEGMPKFVPVSGIRFYECNMNIYVITVHSTGFVVISEKGIDKLKAFRAHSKSIKALAVVNDLLITASVDTTVKIWDLTTLEEFHGKLRQVGLFFCRCPIASLDAKYVGGKCLIFVGDCTGNVEILQFIN